jgi:hypothetical protein
MHKRSGELEALAEMKTEDDYEELKSLAQRAET